jgi:hypothetical protein
VWLVLVLVLMCWGDYTQDEIRDLLDTITGR